jgi:hypothetical protein
MTSENTKEQVTGTDTRNAAWLAPRSTDLFWQAVPRDDEDGDR